MFELIFPILIIIILWYIAFDCNKRLSGRLSKQVVLVFTSIIYFLIMMIYMFCNKDECYNHIPLLNFELIVLLILVPTVTVVSNLVFIHARIPKLI